MFFFLQNRKTNFSSLLSSCSVLLPFNVSLFFIHGWFYFPSSSFIFRCIFRFIPQ
uniref:Uncharacterized protein n=1 Tax=Anopheles funestus TaxID=62324 RepID=A0A182S2B3_ANOFN